MANVNNAIYELYGDRWYTADDDPIALLRAESRAKTPWILNQIRAVKSIAPSTTVLDVGCGAGFLSNELAKNGLTVTGVDLSPESLNVARAHDSTKSVIYQTADAGKLPFADGSFDVVTALDFLEHVENPAEIIKEFARVLKPGGIFIFHTFNRNWVAYLVVIKLVEWFVRNTPKHMHILRLFIKPEELKTFCRQAGMQPGEIVGIKPVFSTIPVKNVFTGIVPKGMRFEIVKSTLLSYMGLAVKVVH
jgi:2-polyprenyl-6-hydroxyphenyl methylase / 3-demethylubiquinone-9 3-methyltransferase